MPPPPSRPVEKRREEGAPQVPEGCRSGVRRWQRETHCRVCVVAAGPQLQALAELCDAKGAILRPTQKPDAFPCMVKPCTVGGFNTIDQAKQGVYWAGRTTAIGAIACAYAPSRVGQPTNTARFGTIETRLLGCRLAPSALRCDCSRCRDSPKSHRWRRVACAQPDGTQVACLDANANAVSARACQPHLPRRSPPAGKRSRAHFD